MFAVVYRWKLKAGADAAFREAWREATVAIQARFGTSGSRLHRTDDEHYVAYAVWPSQAAWAEARQAPPPNPDASSKMREAIEQSFPAMMLEVVDDLLQVEPPTAR